MNNRDKWMRAHKRRDHLSRLGFSLADILLIVPPLAVVLGLAIGGF